MSNGTNRVYVVDDDEAYRRSLVRLLTSAGYFVESFASGQDFLEEVLVDCRSGVAILDLRMPDMDGFELQKRMNLLKSRLKIIFITAFEQLEDRERALQAGAVAFLQKPFGSQAIIEKINLALGAFPAEEDKEESKERCET
ncbi:MAG: response regulator [Sedimentisphaerales bacterium]|nr:response regulator [Sedimentisphaerales bacterium]